MRANVNRGCDAFIKEAFKAPSFYKALTHKAPHGGPLARAHMSLQRLSYLLQASFELLGEISHYFLSKIYRLSPKIRRCFKFFWTQKNILGHKEARYDDIWTPGRTDLCTASGILKASFLHALTLTIEPIEGSSLLPSYYLTQYIVPKY